MVILKACLVLALAIFQVILPAASADGGDHRVMPFDSHQLVTRDADQDLSGTVSGIRRSGLSLDVLHHLVGEFVSDDAWRRMQEVSAGLAVKEGRIPLHKRGLVLMQRDLSLDSLVRLLERPSNRGIERLTLHMFYRRFLEVACSEVKRRLEEKDATRFTELRSVSLLSGYVGYAEQRKIPYESKIGDNDLKAVLAVAVPDRINELALCNGNGISIDGIGNLAGLTQLTSLDLAGCINIQDGCLEHLAPLTRLTSLDLDHCYLITDSGLKPLFELTALKKLSLAGCDQITDEAIRKLKEAIPGIEVTCRSV